MQQIVVRIPAAQKAFLDQLAQKQNTTLSNLTRQALGKLVSDHTKKTKNLLLELAEIGAQAGNEQAPNDLSTQYKSYLYK